MKPNTQEPLPVRRVKRVFDFVMALVLLLALSPFTFILLAALLLERCFVKDSRGPIIYREPRISRGEVFMLLKLRTVKQRIIDDAVRAAGGLKTIKDLEQRPENLTRLGVLLKDHYLDELPQLINVLRGEMSFVGPRPWPPQDHYEAVAKGYNMKGLIHCGITGLFQCQKGHTMGDMQLDLEYIEAYRTRGSLGLLWFDITIMLRSIKVLLEGKGL